MNFRWTRMRTPLLLAAAVLVGLLATVGAGVLARPYTYHGSLIDPPAPAADFRLADQDGKQYQLSHQRGRLELIFFGFTHCPDVCPVTLTKFKQIKAQLGEAANQVDFIFISVDPERDSPEQIRSYLANYDSGFIGLTGGLAELQDVWKNYGVYVEKGEVSPSGNYEVDHTARIYAIDPDGNWRVTYPYEMDPDAVARDVRQVFKESR